MKNTGFSGQHFIRQSPTNFEFKENREALVQGFHEIAGRVEGLSIYQNDQFEDGTTGPMKDICPFTLMGSFNRGVNESTRKSIAKELADFLGLQNPCLSPLKGYRY